MNSSLLPSSFPFERILLTGFRACGKSRVGRLLARNLGWDFLDTDVLLCERFGCSVSDYVAAHGWKEFRAREEELLRELCGRSRVVVAAGGGAILHEETWKRLRNRSVCFWLQADEQTILERMGTDHRSGDQRPSLTGSNPAEEVKILLAERTPLYRNGSDYGIDTTERTPREIVEDIITVQQTP